MIRNHICFTLVLLLLLIAPKIPLLSLNLPDKSSVSLGLIGLIIWAFVYPRYIFSFINGLTKVKLHNPVFLLILYSLYVLFISLLSLNLVSIVYAVQYFIYVILSAALFSEYFNDVFKLNQFKKAFKIISFVSLIFSVGAIISVVTGPIYPQQVLAPMRGIENIFIPRAIGFTENANFTGGILIILLPFNCFLSCGKNIENLIVVFVSFVALLMTLSRSAIFSILISLMFYIILKLVFNKLNKTLFMYLFGLIISSLFFYFILSYFIDSSMMEHILISLGVHDSYFISSDTDDRLLLWQGGIDNILEKNTLQIFFGQGFRNSFYNNGRAWITPHNLYIAILGDFGIIGLLLFLTPFFNIICQISLEIKKYKNTYLESFAIISLLGLLIHNFSEVFFYSPVTISLTIIIMTLYLGKNKW